MGNEAYFARQARLMREELDRVILEGASDEELADAIAAHASTDASDAELTAAGERGVGTQLQGIIPNGYYWRVSTQVGDGWDAPTFTMLDGASSFVMAPFTDPPTPFTFTALDQWQHNTFGNLLLRVTAAIIAPGGSGTNGHMYLEAAATAEAVSAGEADLRLDWIGLRNGAAGS